ALRVVIDYTAPTVSTPDLLPSSDTAGISIDNITRVQTPVFTGTVEPNAEIRLVNNGSLGQRLSDNTLAVGGMWTVGTNHSLSDGVYKVSVIATDVAGNFNEVNFAPQLKVTIAHDSLTLTDPNADVIVNLAESTIVGFPEIPGGIIGIRDIPVVNLDVGTFNLRVVGGTNTDKFLYTQ